jgi:hypothetical protein
MALSAAQCKAFNEFLFRRVPDWDKELAKDRFPYSYIYSGMYDQKTWPSFTGTTHTWDKVHVTRPNDDGNWEEMSADACVGAPCNPDRKFTGWGSTRNTYVKYHRDYQSPVFCFDQLRHIEEAEAQLAAIIEGHKDMPEAIISDFLRQLSVLQGNVWYSCGSALTTVTPSYSSTTGLYDFGGDAYLPTSKLNMGYLDNHIENLQYNGYFDRMFTPNGTFLITSDIQTHRELTARNPDLVQMYNGADFRKGGQFFSYGLAMKGIGNWSFKIDPEPIRAQRMTAGKLQRIWPYRNVAATTGKKPQFDTAYKNAQYQMFHVYNKAAREIYVGDTSPVNPEMKFVSRNLLGKWSWKNPDYFTALDPASGTTCSYQNDKKNMGYFLAEFELGSKTIYPEIEMIIWAQREPQAVIDTARCATAPASAYQVDLYPYNGDNCSV